VVREQSRGHVLAQIGGSRTVARARKDAFSMRYAGRGHDKKHVDEMRRTKFMSVVVIEQTKNKKQKTKNKKK
jgi:hypothetical protein